MTAAAVKANAVVAAAAAKKDLCSARALQRGLIGMRFLQLCICLDLPIIFSFQNFKKENK